MDKKQLCEAMYALPGGVVVRRQKNKGMALATIVVAVVMLSSTSLFSQSMTANLSSAAVLVGISALVVGVIWLLSLLFDKEGQPVLARTNLPLRYEERYFPLEERGRVMQLIDGVKLAEVVTHTNNQVSGIVVALYRNHDNTFGAMQAYEYIDYEYRPITPVRYTDTQR